jgi:hypothetical protein
MLDRNVPRACGGKVPRDLRGIEVPRVDYEKLISDRLGESSAMIRERVQTARERQRVRFEGSDIICPVQEPGLSSRAGTGIITTPTCAWRKCVNSVN